SLLAVVLLILSAAAPRTVEAQKPPATPTPNSKTSHESQTPPLPTPTEQAIPLPQIADRVKELHNRLVEIYQQLSSTQGPLPSEGATQARDEKIRERGLFVDALVNGMPTSLELRDEDHYWISLSRQFASEREFLTSSAPSLEHKMQFPKTQQSVWQATLDQIGQMRGIQSVVDRVQQELTAIKTT